MHGHTIKASGPSLSPTRGEGGEGGGGSSQTNSSLSRCHQSDNTQALPLAGTVHSQPAKPTPDFLPQNGRRRGETEKPPTPLLSHSPSFFRHPTHFHVAHAKKAAQPHTLFFSSSLSLSLSLASTSYLGY
ncbi:hypothetical protein CGRA01v4_00917 [Colletotrichum graminicola]|nr:hypothetical protein CGRA01v4_00917 [Colletotrichum graminicola]